MAPIQIVHGYSRDHRPVLKQFVLNPVCWDDGDIPAYLELADGNQSDKVRFGLSEVRWLTHVPSLRAASELVTTYRSRRFNPLHRMD